MQKLVINFGLVSALSLLTNSCAQLQLTNSYDSQKPMKLEVVPEIGRVEITQYHSRAVNRIYKEKVLFKKSNDDLDFQVKTTIESVEPMANRINLKVEAISKSGEGDLHEFAIPEIGELLPLVINEKAEVLEAGSYPKDSIFFLPTIGLPKNEVQIGDSWALNVGWVTETQKIPLKMELVSILKEVRKCDSEHCALIELDGEVKLDGKTDPSLSLKSGMRGYIYFSIEKGTVVWSHIRSDQEFKVGPVLNIYHSCLVSYVTSPKQHSFVKRVNPFCEPEAELTPEVIP